MLFGKLYLEVNYLTRTEILFINHKMALLFGGLFVPPDNIKDDQAFEYMLEAVEGEIYGIELYPEISTKAAIYLHNITCNHIFNDGTKRTGLAAALLFLEKNNFILKPSITNQQLINFMIEVAEGKHNIESISDWLQKRIIKKY